jgi:hypothetical protein
MIHVNLRVEVEAARRSHNAAAGQETSRPAAILLLSRVVGWPLVR